MKRIYEDFLKGYNSKNAKFFDKFTDKVYLLTGKLIQMGFFDLDANSNVFICANRQDIGEDAVENRIWEIQDLWSYYVNGLNEDEIKASSYATYNKSSRFNSRFDIYALTIRRQISPLLQRVYFFCGDSPDLYYAALNHLDAIKKMLNYLDLQITEMVNASQDHKINMAKMKKDYFIQPQIIDHIDIFMINEKFQTAGILKPENLFTNKELQCLKLCVQGKSSIVSGFELGISHRTVEGHLRQIKEKLGVSAKSEIIECLFRGE